MMPTLQQGTAIIPPPWKWYQFREAKGPNNIACKVANWDLRFNVLTPRLMFLPTTPVPSKNPCDLASVKVNGVCSCLLLPVTGFIKITISVLFLGWHLPDQGHCPVPATSPWLRWFFSASLQGLQHTSSRPEHEGSRNEDWGGAMTGDMTWAID